MPDILLTTLNARYAHAAFGLRYLLANLGELRDRAAIAEFDIKQQPVDVLEAILAHKPRIVGLGVYIWNIGPATQLAAELKRLRPDITLVLGGPEISYEIHQQEIARHADYIITGEADLAFADLCRQLLAGSRPSTKVIPATPPEMDQLALPYGEYGQADIAHRVVYVEASRGCPFSCEFCLSSLDIPVRNVSLDRFLPAMDDLLKRGLRQFKFVDRTFNLNTKIGTAILEFFRERYEPGLFLHFEMIPDRLPEALREPIRWFPAGALQFEVGIQTFNEEVSALISRRQDNVKVEANLRFLREETGVHVHADLIAGLPGEDMTSFAAGFDRLVALGPQEIQLGILKRLRGTPIVRHDQTWEMIYSPTPPYEILQTKLVPFADMQRMRRFARYWDMIANSGNFIQTTPLIWREGSPFATFMALSDWLHGRTGRTHGIALPRLVELLLEYLAGQGNRQEVARALAADYQRPGRRDLPESLRAVGLPLEASQLPATSSSSLPARQARHAAKRTIANQTI